MRGYFFSEDCHIYIVKIYKMDYVTNIVIGVVFPDVQY